MLRSEFFDKVFVLLLNNEPFNAFFHSVNESIKVYYTSGSLVINNSVTGSYSFFINDDFLTQLQNVLQTQENIN